MGELELHPSRGNVAFGSGKECWAFTLDRFAKIYSKKFKIAEDKLIKKFWGDWYFDAPAKKWLTEPEGKDGSTLKR
jgi:elongation factor 2